PLDPPQPASRTVSTPATAIGAANPRRPRISKLPSAALLCVAGSTRSARTGRRGRLGLIVSTSKLPGDERASVVTSLSPSHVGPRAGGDPGMLMPVDLGPLESSGDTRRYRLKARPLARRTRPFADQAGKSRHGHPTNSQPITLAGYGRSVWFQCHNATLTNPAMEVSR